MEYSVQIATSHWYSSQCNMFLCIRGFEIFWTVCEIVGDIILVSVRRLFNNIQCGVEISCRASHQRWREDEDRNYDKEWCARPTSWRASVSHDSFSTKEVRAPVCRRSYREQMCWGGRYVGRSSSYNSSIFCYVFFERFMSPLWVIGHILWLKGRGNYPMPSSIHLRIEEK